MKILSGFIDQRVRSLVYGATLPLTALKLILRSPKLLALSAIPVAISLALYAYVILRLQDWAKIQASNYFLAQGWDQESWLIIFVQIGVSILLFLVGAFTFSIVTSIVAAPFNDFLAEKAEPLASPPLPPAPQTKLAGKIRIILIDVAKMLAATVATLFAILLSWVPVVNVLALALALLLVTFQYVSYPQTRRGQGVGHGLRFLWSHAYCCIGFGAVVSALFSLPLVSVLAVPIAVVGGTLLVGRAQVRETVAGTEIYRLK